MHRITLTVGPDAAGQRLDRIIAGQAPALSREAVKRLIGDGAVCLERDGRAITPIGPATRLKGGETINITVPDAAPAVPLPQAMALDIVFEDEALIVIDKPAGLVVHPAAGNADRTLVNALLAHCGDSLSGIGGVRRPGIVHRLDKDTSGLLVVAKTDAAHRALAAQFEAHSIERQYLALVWGIPHPLKSRISGNIGRSRRNRKKMAVLAAGGKQAATRYRVVQRFGQTAALLECRLETGRTHQIRVHMAHIGHPVIGDPLYGRARAAKLAAFPEPVGQAIKALGRQALHARLLGFAHPGDGRILKFESPIPHDMQAIISGLGKSAPG